MLGFREIKVDVQQQFSYAMTSYRDRFKTARKLARDAGPEGLIASHDRRMMLLKEVQRNYLAASNLGVLDARLKQTMLDNLSQYGLDRTINNDIKLIDLIMSGSPQLLDQVPIDWTKNELIEE